MPLDAQGHEPSGGGGGMHMPAFLSKKYGPLPGWGWGVGLAVLIGLYIHHKRAASGTASAASGSSASAPVGTPVGSGATGFTQDQLGQLSGLVNGSVASGLANATQPAGSASTATGGTTAQAPTTNPLAAYVNTEFQNLLGRPADAAGGGYWSNQLAAGQTPSQQFVSIGSTPEAQAYAATNPGGFVTGQYETLLNRQPDAAGLAYWTNILQANHGNTGAESAQFLQAAQPELKH